MFREWVIFDGLMYKECNFSLYTCIQENRWSSQCIWTWKHERIFKKEDKKKQWKETKHSHVWSLRPSRQIVFKSSLLLSVFLFFRRNAVKWGWPPMSNIKCHLIDCQSRVIERNITVFSTRSATEWRQHQINELHMDRQRLNNKNKLRNLSEIKKKRKNAGGCDNNGTRSHVHSQYTVTCFFIYTASTLLKLCKKKLNWEQWEKGAKNWKQKNDILIGLGVKFSSARIYIRERFWVNHAAQKRNETKKKKNDLFCFKILFQWCHTPFKKMMKRWKVFATF